MRDLARMDAARTESGEEPVAALNARTRRRYRAVAEWLASNAFAPGILDAKVSIISNAKQTAEQMVNTVKYRRSKLQTCLIPSVMLLAALVAPTCQALPDKEPPDPRLAIMLENQGKFRQAAELWTEILEVLHTQSGQQPAKWGKPPQAGPIDQLTIDVLLHLALCSWADGKTAKADGFFKQVFELQSDRYGPFDWEKKAMTLDLYSGFLKQSNRNTEAAAFLEASKQLRSSGPLSAREMLDKVEAERKRRTEIEDKAAEKQEKLAEKAEKAEKTVLPKFRVFEVLCAATFLFLILTSFQEAKPAKN